MRTIDETIKANECCDHEGIDCRCKDCPYSGIDACILELEADALYYLKELRHILDNTVWVESTKEEKGYWKLPTLPETGNDPLTWNELRKMKGKPVWVEFFYEDGQHFDSDWFLVGFVSESFCDVIGKLGTSRLVKNDYWQAYRKEKE